mmetsp:Transcript_14653/g.34580  ORF Transcript_14653/g.34580 Transcript_14653/m.34580 type:complete len:218 (-) Transcript_14653:988-1641(-)
MIHHDELMVQELHPLARKHVIRLEDLASHLIQMHALLQELASDNAQVSLRRLVNGHGVIREIVVEDKQSVNILWLWVGELGCEAQDLARIVEELDKVLLHGLGNKTLHRSHRIVPGTEAVVRWCLRTRNCAVWKANIFGIIQADSDRVLVVTSREAVGIIDVEGVSHQLCLQANVQILWRQELVPGPFLLQRSIHHNWSSRQLLPSEEDREVVPPTI